jgi:hypothetical protein
MGWSHFLPSKPDSGNNHRSQAEKGQITVTPTV